MSQWFCSFYWRDFSPSPFTESQKQKILESQGGTCDQQNCNSELEIKDGQFLHIKQYVDYSPNGGAGMAICKQCFDNIRDREKLDWRKLAE